MESGICPRCVKRPPEPGSSWCRKCLDEKNEAARKNHARKRAAGIPPKPRTELEKARQKEHDRARAHKPERKESQWYYSQMLYQKRKSLGLCVECGEEAHEGKTRCERHLEILRESSRRTAARKKAQRDKEKGK